MYRTYLEELHRNKMNNSTTTHKLSVRHVSCSLVHRNRFVWTEEEQSKRRMRTRNKKQKQRRRYADHVSRPWIGVAWEVDEPLTSRPTHSTFSIWLICPCEYASLLSQVVPFSSILILFLFSNERQCSNSVELTRRQATCVVFGRENTAHCW